MMVKRCSRILIYTLLVCISVCGQYLPNWNWTLQSVEKTGKSCFADLAEAFIQVGKGAGNNASITVMLSASCDGKGLPTACLAIGKYGAIIASQNTAHTETHVQGRHWKTHSKFDLYSLGK